MLDFSQDTPPFPQTSEHIARRIEMDGAMEWARNISSQHISEGRSQYCSEVEAFAAHLSLPLSQLTANEYFASQGIAPHTDTSACFGPLIFIVSCGSGITMTFRKCTPTNEAAPAAPEVTAAREKLHVWLPRRSLLIISSDARYAWSHAIASRKFDKINSELIPRERRVSLTFRQALVPGEIPREQLISSALERCNVFDVYDEIALHWHHTRGKRKVHWHRVKEFLMSIPRGSLVADVGSGDGKYFGVNDQIITIGCDRSLNLLNVSRDVANETFCCDAVKLPLRDECFDASICIAVMHHLGTIDRRIAVIRELMRIIKTGGSVFLQAWAMEQGDGSKRQFNEQDVMVPWRLNQKYTAKSSEKCPEEIKEVKITTTGESRSLGSAANFDQGQPFEERSITDNSTADVESTISESYGKEGKRRVKGKGKEKIEAIDRSVVKKPYRSLMDGSVVENGDLGPTPGGGRIDGRDELITYERYCHVYKKGELEDLCRTIPCCRVVESGWDKSNWFVHLQKIDDPRIALSNLGDESTGNGYDVSGVEITKGVMSRQIRGAGIPQAMPVITLRTLS